MIVEQSHWDKEGGWQHLSDHFLGKSANLVFVFGGRDVLTRARMQDIRKRYPNATIAGCSTAGEICGTRVSDDTVITSAIKFEKTKVKGYAVSIKDCRYDSRAVGKKLAGQIDKKGLRHVLVLSDGLKVNGTALINGLVENLPKSVTLTGGLAGDGERFKQTVVFLDGAPEKEKVAVICFYGTSLQVGHGSLGGWDPFGPDRLITKSKGNVLYELDGQAALDLYKKYLGPEAKNLPGSALLFPLSIRAKNDGQTELVRTILAVDEKKKSMTFAGDVPEGHYAKLMKANFDRLIDGAAAAAKSSFRMLRKGEPQFALLISCVGRKMVLRQRTEEEVEGVRNVLGPTAALAGFYSYGEISPFNPAAKCELHNQTMTITTFLER